MTAAATSPASVVPSGSDVRRFYRWQRRYDPYDLTCLEGAVYVVLPVMTSQPISATILSMKTGDLLGTMFVWATMSVAAEIATGIHLVGLEYVRSF